MALDAGTAAVIQNLCSALASFVPYETAGEQHELANAPASEAVNPVPQTTIGMVRSAQAALAAGQVALAAT